MDEELVGQLYPEGRDQWLNIQMDIMASGVPQVCAGTCTVAYLHQLQHSGVRCTLGKFADTIKLSGPVGTSDG